MKLTDNLFQPTATVSEMVSYFDRCILTKKFHNMSKDEVKIIGYSCTIPDEYLKLLIGALEVKGWKPQLNKRSSPLGWFNAIEIKGL